MLAKQIAGTPARLFWGIRGGRVTVLSKVSVFSVGSPIILFSIPVKLFSSTRVSVLK